MSADLQIGINVRRLSAGSAAVTGCVTNYSPVRRIESGCSVENFASVSVQMNVDISVRLKMKADLICILILCDQISDRTIDGERKLLRQWCAKFLPDKLELYDMVYESRFERLISQFRPQIASI